LRRVIAQLADAMPRSDRVALTMTAELCDCYPTKRDGVRAVLDAVAAGLPGRVVRVWGLDARFHPPDAIWDQPLLAAAANWLTLGDIPENPDDRATADGRPATIDAARDRLARMVGADRDRFSGKDAVRFSEAASDALLARLVQGAEMLWAGGAERQSIVVVSG